MRGKRVFIGLRALAIFAVSLMATSSWAATHWTATVLLNFNNGVEQPNNRAGLVFDAAGNLYGTTQFGGAYSGGTAFKLSPAAGGGWTETVLHNFSQNGTDGYDPVAGLIFDAAGNLYGTTGLGGTYTHGTVFELSPSGGGDWTETILHNFNGADGYYPTANLVFDAAGNLYGTTNAGGIYCTGYGFCGTVFELTPTLGGGWTEKVLHSFGGAADGQFPWASVIIDAAGNLYGTTQYGGNLNCPGNLTFGCGIVFELIPSTGGRWREKVLHRFERNGIDGWDVFAGLISDTAGNLYGTTALGGTYDEGTVFELTPAGDGNWTETLLHNFNLFCPQQGCVQGVSPTAALVFDPAGNLYGTTYVGGTYTDGTVFELTPAVGGNWTKAVLYNFNATDGYFPCASLILDAVGNLYGTTSEGGIYGNGTVFELTHSGAGLP